MDLSLNDISKTLANTWKTQCRKSIKDLQYALYDALRNMDVDDNGPSISELVATPIPTNGVVPFNVLHIIIGIVSNKAFEAQLNIGGRDIGETFKIIPFDPSLILDGWPVVDCHYHEICILGIPTDTCIWALGVRVKKNILSIIENTRVPGHLLYENGLTYPDNGIDSEKTWYNLLLSKHY